MIDYSTNPQELLLMIGDREFQHYKAKLRVEELEITNKELTRIIESKNTEIDRLLELLRNGRLEQTNNDLSILHRNSPRIDGEGLRRSIAPQERSDEPDRRDDKVVEVTCQVSGESCGQLYGSSS